MLEDKQVKTNRHRVMIALNMRSLSFPIGFEGHLILYCNSLLICWHLLFHLKGSGCNVDFFEGRRRRTFLIDF